MYRLLIAEDDPSLRKLLSQILTTEKHEAFAVANGMEALMWLDNGNKVDIVIADCNEQQYDGKWLYTKLKESGMYRHLPFVMLMEKDKLAASVFPQSLGKPFNPEDLSAAITSAMQTSLTET